MKRKLFLFAVVIASLAFSSCTKTPVFKVEVGPERSDNIFGVGESVEFKVSAGENYDFEWDFGDQVSGFFSKEVEHYYDKPGRYLVTVTAYSKNHKKSASQSVEIEVRETGEATFYTSEGEYYITVHLLGRQSKITKNFSSTPTCGSTGTAYFSNVPYGTYSYTASDGWYIWKGTVKITKGNCFKIQLTY